MKYFMVIFLIGLIISGLIWIKNKPAKMLYKIGDKIKNYKLPSDDGAYIETEKLIGSWVIFYFYPKDDTPGCTMEAQTFSSLLNEFKSLNTQIFGINTDSPESHKKFKKKYELTVTLLTDSGKTMARDLGVKVLAGFCSRDTILINPAGQIEKIFRGVNPAGHPGEILKYVQKESQHTGKNLDTVRAKTKVTK